MNGGIAARGLLDELRARDLITDADRRHLGSILETILKRGFRHDELKSQAESLLTGEHSPTGEAIARAMLTSINCLAQAIAGRVQP